MATAAPDTGRTMAPAHAIELHFVLRFSFATAAVFVLCEWMGWQPSALAPVLTAVLLANLPNAPPLKAGLVLILIMAAWAWLAFLLTTYLEQVPHILFLIVGTMMFVAFHGLAQSKAPLPLTLLLICLAVVPLMTLTAPVVGEILTQALVRAMALAVIATWCAYAIWPIPPAPRPAPPPVQLSSPAAAAGLATATVLPLVLVYLLFGLTDAIPVLLTTVLIVANMDEKRGTASGWAKLIGNFVGGLVAIAAFYLLQISPSLATLAVICFIVSFGFALQIAKGGAHGGNALLAYNAAIIILGLALLKGDANSGTFGARLVQFGIACTFAIGMMALLWPRLRPRP
jgi:hypothetical protein